MVGPKPRGKSLKQLTPNELVGGAPVTVQLSADEIRRVVAELQQQEAKANEGSESEGRGRAGRRHAFRCRAGSR